MYHGHGVSKVSFDSQTVNKSVQISTIIGFACVISLYFNVREQERLRRALIYIEVTASRSMNINPWNY